MPTLSTLDFGKLDEACEEIKLLLTADVSIEDVDQAFDLLAAVRTVLHRVENPDGKYPVELEPGDSIELDDDVWVTVLAYPWKSREGNRWTGDMVVIPIDGDPTIVTLPADVRVAVA